MKVVFTEPALADLDEILTYTDENYPHLADSIERRIHDVLAQIRRWPRNARTIDDRPGVRAVPLARYPYRIYYRIEGKVIEVLHIRHTSRQPWADDGTR